MTEDAVRVEFEGSEGRKLAGLLHLPPGPARAYAVFAHCFTCGKDLPAAVRISEALAVHGIATLRFDFTGLGESEGDFSDTGFGSNVGDIEAAARHLAETRSAPTLLIGHSLGGAAVLAAAPRIEGVRGVATLEAPFSPSFALHMFPQAEAALAERGEAQVTIAGRTFRVKQALLDDLEAHHPGEALAALDAALLILHSPDDDIVDIDNARRIYEAARHPKSFITLDGAGHLLPRRADVQYAADMLATWAKRYVPEPAEGHAVPLKTGEVDVHGRGTYLNHIHTPHHTLVADEPVDMGGTDQGPNPYDLLLSALGACTSMTLRMYAGRKKWPLKAVNVRLHHDHIHAKDCADCESKDGVVNILHRSLHIEGDLDDEQRQRLTEIANKCPIHRIVTGEVRVKTVLEPD